MTRLSRFVSLACGALLAACSSPPCDSEPDLRTTDEDIEFVRTPEACFEDLPEWDFKAQYVTIDGLRQAYVEEGPNDGPVVLLLHGQPSWSYLYRKMIPVLSDAGFRVIAMDHLGMGRSDKPTNLDDYTFLVHYDRLGAFIEELELTDIHLFVQDWGSLLGLRYAGLNPDKFAAIAVGNGDLPDSPAGPPPWPEPENPEVPNDDLESLFTSIPEQQTPFYDGCDSLLTAGGDGPNFNFGGWIEYSMTASVFTASEVLEALTWFDLPSDVEAAYDAPYPSRIYMSGPRTFPSHVNDLPGLNSDARAGLEAFDRPFLTIWGGNDPGNLGQCGTQDALVCNVVGAAGQGHVRLAEASHFLQDDQGVEIAGRLVDFFNGEVVPAEYVADCDGDDDPMLPITEDGTGTPCTSDDDCSGLTASLCLSLGTDDGFCTIEGCEPNACGDSYSCCGDCNPDIASMLPFEESACLPEAAASQLEAGAGCTCE
ncbi:MAG: haloalkane dehalogenase [Myxococcota bacterium]